MDSVFEKIEQALKNVRADPYDLQSWYVLLKDAENRPIDDVREPVYEKLVTVFPIGKFWKAYIEQEISNRNFERAETLFQRCLMKVMSIDLWKTYLKYVKDTKANLPDYKEKMAQAYDFALDKIGMDIKSYPIWNEYIKFLKKVEAVGTFAENQKITMIRKMYQRGIVNPMTGIEQFWKDYISYENSINPIIAAKMTTEKSSDYMNAKTVTREYERCVCDLNRGAPSLPPTGLSQERKQVELWHKYVAWEKSNPLNVQDETIAIKRTMFAYEQAFLCIGHHPSIWLEAANYLQGSAKTMADKSDTDTSKILLDQLEALFEKCTSGMMQKCLLVHLRYADFLEIQTKYEKVHEIYSNFLESEDIDPSLCYIQYMQFCRRAEGTSSARLVFKKAREDPRTSYHVYVAAALMEYYCTKDNKVAGNVFELGFKKFKSNPAYILEYTQFLSHLNEDNNMRVLFERALTFEAMSPKETVDIWNTFLQFESTVGDIGAIKKVEKRRLHALELSEKLPSPISLLIDRYKYNDLLPCTRDELLSIGYEYTDLSADTFINRGNVTGDNMVAGIDRSLIKSSDAALKFKKMGIVASDGEYVDTKKIYTPDTSQMVPFKPKFKWIVGGHRLPGGDFPLPPATHALCQSLPPPDCFQGPFVVVDRLMDVFMTMDLPNDISPSVIPATSNFQASKTLDNNSNITNSSAGRAIGDRIKRRHLSKNDSRSDEEEANTTAPMHDVYIQRQKKKLM